MAEPNDPPLSTERHEVRVRSGARLHFGLFDTQSPFGGLGMMIDQPATEVVIRPAPAFDAGPVDADRIHQIAERLFQRHFSDHLRAGLPNRRESAQIRQNADRHPNPTRKRGTTPEEPRDSGSSLTRRVVMGEARPATDSSVHLGGGLPNCSITVTRQPTAHCGLGSGTQLALSVAAGLARFCGLELSVDELIQQIAGRGKRSAVGSLGFFHGGLIAETGGTQPYSDRSWWSRLVVPSTWRVLLVQPPSHGPAVSGDHERQAFASLPAASSAAKQQLQQLAQEIQSAVTADDFSAFAVALTQFNRLSGQLFAAAQGGCYNGPQVSRLVDTVKAAGAAAYGQSSWGPTVFVICPDQTAARALTDALPPECSAQVVRPQPSAAQITTSFH